MASVELRDIGKTYPGVRALDGVSLTIGSGEFFTLLGPSGCGKTTLLRTVAGFVQQDRGQILFDGVSIAGLPPHRRNTGMVFQDYAIFPHLSVGENIAFGLRNRKVSGPEGRRRVTQALDTVRLSGFVDRMPHELSGGQQQRVGLARAMVIRPGVLLMDEPLSNLDAKLRVELREDIRDIQGALGITTIYVTHDQEEALVVSDRVCVMRAGSVEQIGVPFEVYRRPETRFVAAFVGSMNFLDPWPHNWPPLASVIATTSRNPIAAVRPEDIVLGREARSGDAREFGFEALVLKVSFTGREAQYTLRVADGPQMTALFAHPGDTPMAAPGTNIHAVIPVAALQIFDAGSGRRA